MLYGLSLSFCIKDIMDGAIDEDDVECIISGTAFTDSLDMIRLIHCYSKSYWKSDPCKAMNILYRLMEDDLILQPRIGGYDAPRIVHGHWVEV